MINSKPLLFLSCDFDEGIQRWVETVFSQSIQNDIHNSSKWYKSTTFDAKFNQTNFLRSLGAPTYTRDKPVGLSAQIGAGWIRQKTTCLSAALTRDVCLKIISFCDTGKRKHAYTYFYKHESVTCPGSHTLQRQLCETAIATLQSIITFPTSATSTSLIGCSQPYSTSDYGSN